ncbi:MAG TPA: PEPxxWA-CTERM sorting domain-containing protein [Sphingomonas sp.]|nr:PEPxxWA-CTERM sorting domain-containing protein [Sphingomonas sp.]
MKSLYLIAAASVALVASAAQAQVVNNTSLQSINGAYGAGVATTTTTPTGTRTTVVGPDGGGNRATGTFTTNQWYQANVGGGGTVGITTDYARSGNGSAYFATTSGASKGDLQYNFSTPVLLSSLTSVSYDFYRSSTSTVDANLTPVFRFDIFEDANFAGSLVFENVYQSQSAAPVNTWTTLTASLSNGIFWATNARLGPTFASADGGQKTLDAWIAANEGTLRVTGVSIGAGSGWNNGIFAGGIDNVNFAFSGGPTNNFNFEVAAAAVPEPATWAMMLVGFGMVGGAVRTRRRATSLATA